jgi:dGTPase
LVKKSSKKYPHLKEVHGYHMNDFGAIVAAASLAHDIGNPPLDIPVKKSD